MGSPVVRAATAPATALRCCTIIVLAAQGSNAVLLLDAHLAHRYMQCGQSQCRVVADQVCLSQDLTDHASDA